MVEILQQDSGKELKEQAILILGSLEGTKVWQSVRGFWAKEKDPHLKRLLKTAEQNIRDATSKRKNRVAWDQVKANQNVRERIWQSLRH
jgi:hypothetical protein